MADTRGRRRRNSVTRLLEDVIDDTKDLVDDVLDRTKDLERDGRRAMRRVVDDDDDDRARETTSAGEIDSLKAAIEDLTAKVARLAELQAQAQAPSEPKDK